MKRRPYTYAALAGAALFAWQVFTVAGPRLDRLSAKSEELAHQALAGIVQSPGAMAWVALYALAGFLCHALPLWAATRVLLDLQQAGPEWLRTRLCRRGAHTLLMASVVLTMVTGSRLLFPASYAFEHSDLIVGQTASPVLVFGTPAVLAGLAALWLVYAANRTAVLSTLAVSLTIAGLVYVERFVPLPQRAATAAPDVILIGVDSLRPDHLEAFGFPGPSVTPNLDHLLARSVRFERAYTPQARTFVAYMSILTGRYPTRNQARENLYPRNLFDRSATLPHQFRREGYTTLFAIDEARFANFDASFGFDHLAMPAVGSLDFLLGSVYDTVGTNLFQLLPYSYAVIPHVAGNRGAAATYRAEVFSRHVQSELRTMDPARPMLGYFHFCAAHVPFVYDGKKEPALEGAYRDSPTRYRRALRLADGQVGRLIEDLKRSGRLDNAIVVLLSDHGEALGMQKDAFSLRDLDAMTRPYRIWGHGTYTADETQSRVLLAFARYERGRPIWTGRSLPEAVSLVDIAPTLLEMTDRPVGAGEFDGIALLNDKGKPQAQAERPIFVESGISGSSLQNSKVDEQEVANEFSYLYRVTGDLRYELDPDELEGQLRRKQRGVILGDMLLSSWPRKEALDMPDCWQIVNLTTRTGSCEPPATSDPRVAKLRRLACEHYRNDGSFRQAWCMSGQAGAAGAGR